MPNTKRATVALDASPLELQQMRAANIVITPENVARFRQAIGTPAPVAPDARNEDRLEKAEQHEVRQVFRAFGARVYSLSQARASKQTPGLGDDFVIFPGLVSFWWEAKRQKGGRISPAQEEFHELCRRADGSKHYIGGRREAEAHLIALGIATRGDDGSLYPVRLPSAADVCGILNDDRPRAEITVTPIGAPP